MFAQFFNTLSFFKLDSRAEARALLQTEEDMLQQVSVLYE
jgi:hypothetical protein